MHTETSFLFPWQLREVQMVVENLGANGRRVVAEIQYACERVKVFAGEPLVFLPGLIQDVFAGGKNKSLIGLFVNPLDDLYQPAVFIFICSLSSRLV